jgi:tetratricopeptide (TPR) repeat protein
MWEKSESHFKAAIQQRPNYASPHFGLGSVALMKSTRAKSIEEMRHRAEEGVKHFGKAVQLNPIYTKAMWGLIRCHMTLAKLAERGGNTKDAIEEYQAARSHFQEMLRIDRQFAFSKPERVKAFEEIEKRLKSFRQGP